MFLVVLLLRSNHFQKGVIFFLQPLLFDGKSFQLRREMVWLSVCLSFFNKPSPAFIKYFLFRVFFMPLLSATFPLHVHQHFTWRGREHCISQTGNPNREPIKRSYIFIGSAHVYHNIRLHCIGKGLAFYYFIWRGTRMRKRGRCRRAWMWGKSRLIYGHGPGLIYRDKHWTREVGNRSSTGIDLCFASYSLAFRVDNMTLSGGGDDDLPGENSIICSSNW